MLLYVVSVYDLALGAFGRPVFVRSKGEALRSFQNEVNKAGTTEGASAIAEHPQDFQLFYLGMFNDDDGRFTMPKVPEKLVDAVALRMVGSLGSSTPGGV